MIKVLGLASILSVSILGMSTQAQAMNMLAAMGAQESGTVKQSVLDAHTKALAEITPAAGDMAEE